MRLQCASPLLESRFGCNAASKYKGPYYIQMLNDLPERPLRAEPCFKNLPLPLLSSRQVCQDQRAVLRRCLEPSGGRLCQCQTFLQVLAARGKIKPEDCSSQFYIYIYIYIYTHTHTHIYIYAHAVAACCGILQAPLFQELQPSEIPSPEGSRMTHTIRRYITESFGS